MTPQPPSATIETAASESDTGNTPSFGSAHDGEHLDRAGEWEMLRTKHLRPPGERPTHFFFDIGNGNALAFFDFPGLGLDNYAEVLGGHHHLAISMPEEISSIRSPSGPVK